MRLGVEGAAPTSSRWPPGWLRRSWNVAIRRANSLASGLAGGFIEKLQQYGFRLAIVGEIAAQIERSKSLQDFVYETNRRGHHLFVRDLDELRARLK